MPLKGLDRFLDAISRLPGSSALMVLAADDGQYAGEDPGYRSRCIARATAMENVEVRQTVPDIDTVFAKGGVLVVPNRIIPGDKVEGESWGRVVEEALFAGLPVIATDAVPAAVTLICPGVNGTVVPADDDDALLDAMRSVASGDPLLAGVPSEGP
jgi:glycosyltransferase involved in cell wall biosynthesis